MVDNGNIVIVYFSKDGNTRLGAKLLNNKIGGKIVELKEVKKGNFIQALMKKGSMLEGNPWKEMGSANQVYLMTPIWASNGTPAMNAFIQNADFTGKKICVITFQQFEDLRNSDRVHQYISDIVLKNNGTICSKYALLGGKMGHCANDSDIQMQINNVEC